MRRSTMTASITTITHELTATAGTRFTDAEARSLETLRLRYREDHDLFSRQELARLRFLRWLVSREHFIV